MSNQNQPTSNDKSNDGRRAQPPGAVPVEHQMTRQGQAREQRTPERAERVHQRPMITPPVDVYETKDEVVLVADLPGVRQDGLRIDVVDDRLTIFGARSPVSHGQRLARELQDGDFQRVFLLPDGIDHAAIDAKLKHGVLTVRLPKAAAVKPRRIEVKSG